MSGALGRLGRRVAMALGLGRLTANTDETASTPTVQAALAGGELRSDVPLLQQVGFHSRPLPGSDVVVLFQAGDRARGVAIATGDQRAYPRDLQPGDVCLYHVTAGSRIWLKADGSIAISAQGELDFTGGKAVFNCPISCAHDIVAQGDVQASGISLSKHKHPVQTAPGTTGAPE